MTPDQLVSGVQLVSVEHAPQVPWLAIDIGAVLLIVGLVLVARMRRRG